MKLMVFAFLLIASSAAADTQVPRPTPAPSPIVGIPAPAAAPEPKYRLAFSARPAEAPDASAWPYGQGEAVIANRNVLEGVKSGKDRIISTLVARKVCDPSVNVCNFLTRFVMLDQNPADQQSKVAMQYAIQGESGVLTEGYASLPTRDPKDYRHWRRVGDSWQEVAAAEREAEMGFVGELLLLITALEQRGEFRIYDR